MDDFCQQLFWGGETAVSPNVSGKIQDACLIPSSSQFLLRLATLSTQIQQNETKK